MSTAYDSCGTSATVVEDGINFEQTISVQTYSGFIKLANPTDVSFSCFFNSTVGKFFGLYFSKNHKNRDKLKLYYCLKPFNK